MLLFCWSKTFDLIANRLHVDFSRLIYCFSPYIGPWKLSDVIAFYNSNESEPVSEAPFSHSTWTRISYFYRNHYPGSKLHLKMQTGNNVLTTATASLASRAGSLRQVSVVSSDLLCYQKKMRYPHSLWSQRLTLNLFSINWLSLLLLIADRNAFNMTCSITGYELNSSWCHLNLEPCC